jgi:hypothetical protein
MKEVTCPHCHKVFKPGIVMCSNPLQVDCRHCGERFYLDTEGHSSLDSFDPCFGGVTFNFEDGCPPEVIGKVKMNVKGISKLKFDI